MARRQRRYRRLTVRVEVEYLSPSGPCCEVATTLGAGGLCIATDEPLPVGTPLKLRFRLRSGASPHEMEGRVAWSQRPGDGPGGGGMGVEFGDPAAVERLARKLDSL